MAKESNKISKSIETIAKEISSSGYPKWQYQRLDSFLIASAFLVAAFFQLVTMDKVDHPLIPCDTLYVLINAIAGLGSVIAGIYFYINGWVSLRQSWENSKGLESAKAQTIHTWLIPLIFVAFWSIVWCYIPHWDYWWTVITGLLLLCLIFERIRGCLNRFLSKIFQSFRDFCRWLGQSFRGFCRWLGQNIHHKKP